MPLQVVNTAQLSCSMGMAPSSLVVLPVNRVMSGNQPAANIMDHKPKHLQAHLHVGRNDQRHQPRANHTHHSLRGLRAAYSHAPAILR